jgi:fibronectin-binding autotransporter adhesin
MITLRVLAFLLGCATAMVASAQSTRSWICGSGLWQTAACWKPAFVPNSFNDVNFDAGIDTPTQSFLRIDGTTPAAAVGNITFDQPRDGAVFTLSGSSLTVLGSIHAVSGTRSALSIDGGLLLMRSDTSSITTGSFSVGANPGSNGTHTLDGSRSISASVFHVGHAGTGSFTQESGSVVAGELHLGRNTGGVGSYQMHGGTVAADHTSVGFSGTGTFLQTAGTHAVANNLNIGAGSGYRLAGGTLSVGGTVFSEGSLAIDGGTLMAQGSVFSSSLSLGSQAGTSGSHSLSGPQTLRAGNFYIGQSGTGAFAQSDGTHLSTNQYVGYDGAGSYAHSGGLNSAEILSLGHNAGASGSYTLEGTATLSNNFVYIGNAGDGVFVQSGGTHENGTTIGGFSQFVLGNTATGNGLYQLTGGAIDARSVTVGQAGTGTFTQSGGTSQVGSLVVAWEAGSVGTYELSAGTLSTGGATGGAISHIGFGGTGTFTQTGGAHTVGSFLIFGSQASGGGLYDLRAGTLTVGEGILTPLGIGVINIDGGTLAVGGGNGRIELTSLRLGWSAGTSGSHTLSGTANLATRTMVVGGSGTGTFNQAGGSVSVSGSTTAMVIGLVVGRMGTGTYELNGGTLSADVITVGDFATGSFTQSGGSVSISGRPRGISGLNVGLRGIARGTYLLSGGSLSTDTLTVGNFGTGTFVQSGGTTQVSGALTIAANDGSEGVYDLQAGTLTVNNGIINNDRLRIGAAGLVIAAGPGITNSSTGVLSGSGTIEGNVNSAGIVAPGSSAGLLTILGDYTQTGTLAMEIGGLLAGSQYDVLSVSGTAQLDGALGIALINGFGLDLGQAFEILDAGVLLGAFDGLAEGGVVGNFGGFDLFITYAGGDGNDVVLFTAAIPEPETYALLLAGLGLLGFAARRRKWGQTRGQTPFQS